MKLHFYGADRCVTGSCHCLEINGKRILVDCGLQQGRDELDNAMFAFNPGDIDILLVTHAHIDHTGRIPLMVKRGFTGRILTTRVTADLMRIMLLDSAHIQESDAEYRNRKGQRAGRDYVEPLYTTEDAMNVFKFLTVCEYGQSVELCEGVSAVFTDAGHLLGSASITLELTEGGVHKTIVFSGDIGNVDQPIDAVNNQFDRFADHATTPFRLAPTSSGLTGTWNAVPGQTRITSKSRSSEGFSNMPQTIGGRQCHVAELADFEALQKNCQFAFGVLYDDASTETSLNLSDVNGYACYNASNTNKGMRGCFVFNPAGSLNSGGAGANIFFPVGVSGYGRRKHCAQENGKYGVLRYAARSALYTSSDVRYRPLFHTIYTNFGGLYWCNRQSNGTSSWDINVSTYDFNHFGSNAFLISDWTAGDGPNVSDACFVRLVE